MAAAAAPVPPPSPLFPTIDFDKHSIRVQIKTTGEVNPQVIETREARSANVANAINELWQCANSMQGPMQAGANPPDTINALRHITKQAIAALGDPESLPDIPPGTHRELVLRAQDIKNMLERVEEALPSDEP